MLQFEVRSASPVNEVLAIFAKLRFLDDIPSTELEAQHEVDLNCEEKYFKNSADL